MVLEIFAKGMKEEKWFQNPSLSLRELAENVNISSNKLSWLLNERIGQNFNEYINICQILILLALWVHFNDEAIAICSI